MTLSEAFRTNLKALRRRAGWSQELLARKADLSVSYISMIERGQRITPLPTIEVLAKVLGVSPIDMLQHHATAPTPRSRRSPR